MSEKNAKRRGIQSVGNGVNVMSALAAHGGPASLSTIANLAGLSASQTHRYLSSLIEADMVKQLQRSGEYDLAAGAIRIGLAALARADLFTMAGEVFPDFTRETGHTCMLTIWGDAGPTVVRWYDGNPRVVTSLAIGSVLPPLRSATGRIFCAFGGAALMESFDKSILKAERRAFPNHKEIIAEVRKTGGACVQGDLIPGLRATAAPVFDLQGRLVLVASALAHDIEPDRERVDASERLGQACRQLTEMLGGAWPFD